MIRCPFCWGSFSKIPVSLNVLPRVNPCLNLTYKSPYLPEYTNKNCRDIRDSLRDQEQEVARNFNKLHEALENELRVQRESMEHELRLMREAMDKFKPDEGSFKVKKLIDSLNRMEVRYQAQDLQVAKLIQLLQKTSTEREVSIIREQTSQFAELPASTEEPVLKLINDSHQR